VSEGGRNVTALYPPATSGGIMPAKKTTKKKAAPKKTAKKKTAKKKK
jgi:hypothetical protein